LDHDDFTPLNSIQYLYPALLNGNPLHLWDPMDTLSFRQKKCSWIKKPTLIEKGPKWAEIRFLYGDHPN
jgi:hypothetical protein